MPLLSYDKSTHILSGISDNTRLPQSLIDELANYPTNQNNRLRCYMSASMWYMILPIIPNEIIKQGMVHSVLYKRLEYGPLKKYPVQVGTDGLFIIAFRALNVDVPGDGLEHRAIDWFKLPENFGEPLQPGNELFPLGGANFRGLDTLDKVLDHVEGFAMTGTIFGGNPGAARHNIARSGLYDQLLNKLTGCRFVNDTSCLMPPNVPLDAVRHVDLDNIFVAYCINGDVRGRTCTIQEVRDDFVNDIRTRATSFGGGRGSIYQALVSIKNGWGTNTIGRSDSFFKTDPLLEVFLKNPTTFQFRSIGGGWGSNGGGGSNGRGGGGGLSRRG